MRVEAVDDVLRQDLLLLHPVPLVHDELQTVHEVIPQQVIHTQVPPHLVESRDDALDLSSLPALEDEVRHVEHDSLEEEDEGHPLVVRLVRHLVRVRVVGAHAGLKRELRVTVDMR